MPSLIRLSAIAATMFLSVAGATASQAQTWGQPTYTPGPDGPIVHVPRPGYGAYNGSYSSYGGASYGSGGYRYGYGGYGRGIDYGYQGYERQDYGHPRPHYGHDGYRSQGREPRPRPGYRDRWGYNDDRAPSAAFGTRRDGYDDRDCRCSDVYLYDR